MEEIAPITYRSRVLSNHAAEWVERHAVSTTISQLETPDQAEGLTTTPEFVPELDRFAPRGVVFDATKYYEESQRQMQNFNCILDKFVLVLKERNIEAELGIVLKSPADFTLDYVLYLVNKIDERKESTSRTRRCKAFVRNWCRKAHENKDIVEGLIAIIPNTYGSAISGGFTLILAAVEKHVELRDQIQDWLVAIPEQLERIQRLSEVHHGSYRLHSFADAVLVSIFNVLERILNKLTKTWQGIEKAMLNVDTFLKGLPGASEQSKDFLMMKCADMLYRFCASSPVIDPKTGEINRYELKLLIERQSTVPQQSSKETNQAVASRWLAGLKGFNPDPSRDVKDYLEHVEQLDADEKCVFGYILDSEELSRWMRCARSSVLGIDLQTPPARLYNSLSFSSALFVSALKSTNSFPVMSFFCRYRNNSFPGDAKNSGPVAMIKSLNGQLLDFMAKNRPSKDLRALEDRKFFAKAKCRLEHGLKMLHVLISLLPQGDTVFIILDALSYLSGSNLDADLAIRGLFDIIAYRNDIIIKCSPVYKHADLSLHIQDIVPGTGSVNVAESSSKIAKHVKGNQHVRWQN
ncbi:hypothetical protein MMYC01_210158, partial [Madurella mycetomatis]